MASPRYIGKDPKCDIIKAMNESKNLGKDLCIICKGSRLLCGRSYCPLLQRIESTIASPNKERLSKELFGPSPPSIFVGWMGYPQVSIGPMSSLNPENPSISDNPGRWYGMDFNEIVEIRSNLVRSRKVAGVRDRSKLVSDNQELALAVRPADVELSFKNTPRYNLSFSPVSQPMGPTGILDKFKIVDNVKIPRRVDALVHDEVKSVDASMELYQHGHDVYYLSKILSSGSLGLDAAKRLVPTRWSITAVDDMIAKALMKEIREYPYLNEVRVYSNTYLDNHFEVLMMPGAWEFEQFEAWAPKTLWTLGRDKAVIQLEGEAHKGRSDYAEKEGGGYYASRLAVVEGLQRLKRQARVVVFREIYEGYVMPVGVWEVRENVRKAMSNKPEKFASTKEALDDISKRLHHPMNEYFKRSSILRQRRLDDF
jgi:DNA repair protein NreA